VVQRSTVDNLWRATAKVTVRLEGKDRVTPLGQGAGLLVVG
jgi:hypothetical protein